MSETNLKYRRRASGLTQAELSAKARISLRTLQYYEQGALDINKAATATVYRLALVLGCTVEDLLELSVIMDDIEAEA